MECTGCGPPSASTKNDVGLVGLQFPFQPTGAGDVCEAAAYDQGTGQVGLIRLVMILPSSG
jgi:hypothetical protein